MYNRYHICFATTKQMHFPSCPQAPDQISMQSPAQRLSPGGLLYKGQNGLFGLLDQDNNLESQAGGKEIN